LDSAKIVSVISPLAKKDHLAEWREEVKDHRAHFETARRERGTTLR